MEDERSACKLRFCYLRGGVASEGTLVGMRTIIPDYGVI